MSDAPGGRKRLDDDVPPSGSEARAQRRARIQPILWLVIGVILIGGFALLLVGGGGFLHGQSAGPGPVKASSAGSAAASLASGAAPG